LIKTIDLILDYYSYKKLLFILKSLAVDHLFLLREHERDNANVSELSQTFKNEHVTLV
jgi:hypothetical protein